MKNNKGITLIALTITIIILIILASVGTYSGLQALRDSKEDAQIAAVGTVQQAIVENYTKYKMTGNKEYLVGKKIEDYNEILNLIEEINNNSSQESIEPKISESRYNLMQPLGNYEFLYYYELDEDDFEKIGITQEKNKFIVNYSTGEVINKTLKNTKTGKPLYVYSTEGIEHKNEIKITFVPDEVGPYGYYDEINIEIKVESTFELCELKYVKIYSEDLSELSRSDFTEDVPENKNCCIKYDPYPYSLAVYARDIYGNETIVSSAEYYFYPPN